MISNSKEVLDFVDRLVRIDRLGAEKIFNAVREQGSMSRTVDQLILPALEVIGNGWEEGTVALAQVYMSSRICEELMTHVPPDDAAEHLGNLPMAIAVLEDYHQLGKIIISACLRASGYSFQDYGRVTPEELAQKIVEDSIEIVLISTLMLRSALLVKEVKDLLAKSGSSARIVVGGAPFRFDPQLWQEVGADAMGANATEAVAAIATCMSRK
ncbi:MAG: cobalamin-dependent protein [Candidatus Electrothrix scaldis]|nr:MAG: cobalamin-dependent protein [Candidatus Electrothrix sp. GW3-3]